MRMCYVLCAVHAHDHARNQVRVSVFARCALARIVGKMMILSALRARTESLRPDAAAVLAIVFLSYVRTLPSASNSCALRSALNM